MNIYQLKSQISIPFFTHDIIEDILQKSYTNVNDRIMKFIKNKELIRLKKGVYCFSKEHRGAYFDRAFASSILYSPSYLSFEYALSYYSMIPERVYAITCATSINKKLFNTPLGIYSYKKIPIKAYFLGVDWKCNEQLGGYFIATPEKALCDKIRYDKGIGTLSQKNMLLYLTEDLRISLDFHLDSDLIEEIAIAYKSKNLMTLAKVLRKEKL